MNCLSFFENSAFTEEHLHICFNLSNSVRKYLLKKKWIFLACLKSHADKCIHGKSQVHWGYCVAKVHYKYLQKKKSAMFKTDSKNIAAYEEAVICVDLLSELKVNEQYIITTTNQPDSLLNTERRQTSKNRSLTNISDLLFDFFKTVTEFCLKLLTDESLNKYGEMYVNKLEMKYLKRMQLEKSSVSCY